VAAHPSEARAPPEALHQVLNVWNLLRLAEHEASEAPLGVVFDGSPPASCVEARPEDGMDRS